MFRIPELKELFKEELEQIISALNENNKVSIEGMWGSSSALVCAILCSYLKRPALYICPHIDQADSVVEDFSSFLEGIDILSFPSWDSDRFKAAIGIDEILEERLRCITRLQGRNFGFIISAPIQAIMFPLPSHGEFASNIKRISIGDKLDRQELIEWLVEHGYNRLDQVEQPGDFAVRGGIVDIFVLGDELPVRIEFWADVVESIRRFDPVTFRSVEELSRDESLLLIASGGFYEDKLSSSLFDYLPKDTIIFWSDPVEASEVASIFLGRLSDPTGMFTFDSIRAKAALFSQIELSRFYAGSGNSHIRFDFSSLIRFPSDPSEAILQLLELSEGLSRVLLFCENKAEIERLDQLLSERGPSWQDRIRLLEGIITKGFIWRTKNVALLGTHELFNRYSYRYRIRSSRPIHVTDTFFELSAGDYVVHLDYGIGRFEGLRLIQRGSYKEEVAVIRYADNAILNVPASHFHLLQKYIGPSRMRPQLSRLGGKVWAKTKERVASAVTDLARELLEIQARRQLASGIKFLPDSDWQRQLEESFIYQETEDQITAMQDIKADMESERPMDRLICGDVGYGKTELAVRAAFKAVNSGYQVAVLVPTTLLAEQHYRTFRERLAEYPVKVEFISRLKPPCEQKQLLERLSAGYIDIIIGTHRLLSDDVRFYNLGLVIIDEEQRFGVVHKERLKKIRATVDVLTLSATPIPRTLHMALVGLKDISVLASPPLDRRSIQTIVCKFDWQLIREGILRELNRSGQVFFIHNRVHDIAEFTAKLRSQLPEDVRVSYAHGRMKADELEGIMLRFLNRDIDVLVCTTIIESGIDIPTVNTIFIDNADRFGLAELHQLRGRVGRYKHKAYAYLLIPKDRPITPLAARRLAAIEEYSELGAGFRIALRDLEIRGAGNLLGKEQSGHIAAVGYELYCRLLESAVRRLKNGEDLLEPAVRPSIELSGSGYIPKEFVGSDQLRIEIYRRLAAAGGISELDSIREELRDVFGQLPSEVERLLDIARIRILASKYRIKRIRFYDGELVFYLMDPKLCEDIFMKAPFEPRFADPHEVHIKLPPRLQSVSSVIKLLFRILDEAP